MSGSDPMKYAILQVKEQQKTSASYSKQYGMETVVVRPCHTYGPSITPTDNRANVQFISRNVLV